MAYRHGQVEQFNTRWMLDEHALFQPIRDALLEDGEPDELYLDKLIDMMSTSLYYGVPLEPTMVSGNVLLGTQANAENLDCLRRLKITHVLNCAGLPESLRSARARRYRDTGVTYDELAIDDDEDFHILGFFGRAVEFIERGRLRGRVLLHCTGVSRSGAVALAYLMRRGEKLLAAARALKSLRRVVLCNQGFMKQLVQYGRAQNALDLEPHDIHVGKYGRALDRPRILQAHMPDYLARY